ncbi:monovalent cation:proton antiporter-2 (CPA2) family protein [Spirosoma sordidisoli]|uniref:Potassium transporter n=1 Tax=Spirosoma sordidisoli TaxID=2502893 RepID=A0A4Q2UKP7_9BACT|nr:monovalent cation:proton antiporter-2 (CPA2) family protein [Spirosoma sordidisoli]RYC68221.1 potassium transporter [Spirosoma sordidisoli]
MQESFFFQAMVYLAAAVVMVPIAKKIGLGSVLGYLLAGVLIGPACLQFIGQEGTDIMHFAEFGVVMMLFVIGLELEPSRLWRLRKAILGMGGIQIAGTSAVVTGLAVLAGVDLKQALVLGMILSMSSTAIVLQSLNEKGLMQTAAGQGSFAVLLFQDIAVIPMLALFPLLATAPATGTEGGAHGSATPLDALPAWAQPIAVLSAVAAVIIVGRYLTPPLFRIVAKTNMRELFTATALLLVVSIAVLMTVVGLSPALGTFLAGVVLANSEYRHELESDIDPFKGLLLGLFFIAVGASIDFDLIMANPVLILGLVVGVMVCKLVVLLGIGKAFTLSTDQNLIFSFGLCQVGEFAFVLFSFTTQEGILPKELTDIMTAVVAISMAFTPLVMLLNEKLLLPRLGVQEADTRESDVEDGDNPVIIAGYGHFGNTIGRFLQANNVGTTVLDIDSDNVDWLRRMGFKVYYGDASRHDLLEIAGAGKAKIIVIAINDPEKRLELVETIKKHFPDLHILVRSTNRYDAYDLMNAGMLHIYRETLDTSLRLGVDALTLLGYRAHEATRAARTFFTHDERTLKRLSAIRNEDEYVSAARESMEELERVIQADRSAPDLRIDEGWGEESLIADANKNS